MFSHTKKSATLRDEKKGFFFMLLPLGSRGHGRAERYDFFCHRASFDR